MTRNIKLLSVAASIAINASFVAGAYGALKPADRTPSVSTGQYVHTFNGGTFTCKAYERKVTCS